MQHADIATVRKIYLALGIIAIATATWMTFSYGRTMSFSHGIAMGLLTLCAGWIWTARDNIKESNKAAGHALLIVGLLFTSVEYFSHLGYTVGNRVEVTEETGAQNAKYSENQDAVKQEKSSLDFWKKQLDDLKGQNAWVATVTADGLRSQVSVMDKDIELETARGGCKTKCRALMAKKSDLETRISTAEKVDDLTKRIAATERILDTKRDVAVKTEFKSSPLVNQTKFVAQLATMTLEPDKASFTWTQILIGALISLVTTFLAPVCLYIAFSDKLLGSSIGYSKPKAPEPQNPIYQNPFSALNAGGASLNAQTGHLESRIHIEDERGLNALKKELASHADMALARLRGVGAAA